MVVLLKNTDAAEHVNPFLVECTGGMVVAAFTHLRKFKPFVVLDIVHFSSVSRPVLIFTSSSYYHECVRESTDCVTMPGEGHVGSFLKFANRSRRVVELPTFVEGAIIRLKLSSADHED
jgi:hypothetical protein